MSCWEVAAGRSQITLYQGPLGLVLISLCLFCCLAEMLESSNVISFHGLANSSSYHTFLLDEERGRLYVGAKDHIFSFNLVNIKDFQKVASCPFALFTCTTAL